MPDRTNMKQDVVSWWGNIYRSQFEILGFGTSSSPFIQDKIFATSPQSSKDLNKIFSDLRGQLIFQLSTTEKSSTFPKFIWLINFLYFNLLNAFLSSKGMLSLSKHNLHSPAKRNYRFKQLKRYLFKITVPIPAWLLLKTERCFANLWKSSTSCCFWLFGFGKWKIFANVFSSGAESKSSPSHRSSSSDSRSKIIHIHSLCAIRTHSINSSKYSTFI